VPKPGLASTSDTSILAAMKFQSPVAPQDFVSTFRMSRLSRIDNEKSPHQGTFLPEC